MLFIAITLLSVLLRQLLKPHSASELEELLALTKKDWEATQEREAAQKAIDEEGFKHYLLALKEANQNISPTGFALPWRRLFLPDVPLDDTFVNLFAIPDRPIYDMPGEQLRQLQKMQLRTDLSSREREDDIQRLHFTWYSQWRQEEVHAPQQIPIGEVLQRFSLENPVTIILGTPGSGKTTFLRRVAYHHARTLLFSDPSALANESMPVRIPILIQTNDYAEWLTKGPGTLRQFLTIQVSEAHPNALARVLDALEHGRCLVLFDTAATSFKVNSDTQITAVSPPSSSCLTVDVTVTTPGGTSAPNTADKYEYCYARIR
jgi:hypothetical protein